MKLYIEDNIVMVFGVIVNNQLIWKATLNYNILKAIL